MSHPVNYQVASRCALLSEEVYQAFSPELRFTALPESVPRFIENQSTNTEAALLEDPVTQCGYVVFRGSNADRDWLTNLDFSQWSTMRDAVLNDKELDYPEVYGESSSGVKLHRGFTKAYLAVRSAMQAAVRDSAVTHWIVTGHSLGGALAKLCAVDLQCNFRAEIVVETYTFGAPRTGNRAFVKSYNRRVPKTWRFVNGNDVIAGLPSRWQGYRHVERPVRFISPFNWRIISGSFQDHRIDRYIKAVQKRMQDSLDD